MLFLTHSVSLSPDEVGGGGGVREGGEGGEEGEGGGWDVDDELDIPEDIGDVGPATSGEEGYFVPPTKGSPPSQVEISAILRPSCIIDCFCVCSKDVGPTH